MEWKARTGSGGVLVRRKHLLRRRYESLAHIERFLQHRLQHRRCDVAGLLQPNGNVVEGGELSGGDAPEAVE